MSHYDTLGVPKDADAPTIKKAWRKKASESHPDREGGSDERMQAVNKAYEVLADPARRQQYDQTGDDKQHDVFSQAQGYLMDRLLEIVAHSDVNWLSACGKRLRDEHAAIKSHMDTSRRDVLKWQKKAGKVTVKKGANIVQMIIDGNIAKAQAMLETYRKSLEINEKAQQLLADHEGGDVEVIKPHRWDSFETEFEADKRQMFAAMFKHRP